MDTLHYQIVKITDTKGNVWMTPMTNMNAIFQVNDLEEFGEMTGHELSIWCAKMGYTYQHKHCRIGAEAFTSIK